MKSLGILLVFLTGTGCGLLGYLRLKRRACSLELLTRLCEQLAERIRYTAAPLEELLRSLAAATEFETFCLLRCVRRQPLGDPRGALLEALVQSADELGITRDDRRLFEEFAADFGAADLMGEVQRCRQYAALFRERCEAAREDVRCRGRLYVTLGLCGGSALALVLG